MILYHGTCIEAKNKIMNEGFIASCNGDYGRGIYLTNDKDSAYGYGDEIIEVFVDDEYIINIDQNKVKDLKEIPYLAHKNDYRAVCISSGKKSKISYKVICVYDDSVIEINS